jgi:hypothetical protein
VPLCKKSACRYRVMSAMTVLRLGDTVMQRAMLEGIRRWAEASVRGRSVDMTALATRRGWV